MKNEMKPQEQWLEATGTETPVNIGPELAGIVKEISERKRAMEAAQAHPEIQVTGANVPVEHATGSSITLPDSISAASAPMAQPNKLKIKLLPTSGLSHAAQFIKRVATHGGAWASERARRLEDRQNQKKPIYAPV